VEAAKGDWIWFLNSGDCIDERLSPEFLLTLLRQARGDVLIGGLTYDGEKEPRPHLPPAQQWPSLSPWIPHPASLVRKTLFAKVGPFDGRYQIAMDYEWWLRALADDTPVDIVSVPFARFAPGGISQRADSQALLSAEFLDAVRRHQKGLWRPWIARGRSLLKTWFQARFARRIEKPPHSS
jgi:hypothetical protein